MIDLTADTFDEFVKTEETVLVDFWAEWCPPCRAMLPVLEEVNDSQVTDVVKVNADMEIGLAKRFNVRSIPTMILFKNGEESARLVGAVPKEEVLQLIEG